MLVTTLVEHVSKIGGFVCGLTVTKNEQLVEVPQRLVAVHVTVVVPTGNVLPLGGEQVTVGGEQVLVAELPKKTTAPLELVAVTVIFVEHVRTIGGRVTVT